MRTRSLIVISVFLSVLVTSAAWMGAVYIMAPKQSATLTPIRVIFSFVHQGRYVPMYVALDKGYFAEEGLLPTFIPGSGTAFVISTLDQKQVEFGEVETNALVSTLIDNPNIKVRVIFQQLQKSTNGFMTLADSGIMRPKDLEGRTYGDTAVSSNLKLMPLMLAADSGDWSKVSFVPSISQNDLLLAGKVDSVIAALDGVTVVAKIQAAKIGKQIRVFLFSDYGVGVYGHGWATYEDMIKNNPQMVAGFRRAAAKGMQYAVQNPEEAAKIMFKYVPELDQSVLTEQWKASIELSKALGTNNVVFDGTVTNTRATQAIALIVKGYQKTSSIGPERVWIQDITK